MLERRPAPSDDGACDCALCVALLAVAESIVAAEAAEAVERRATITVLRVPSGAQEDE